ncbi:MAG TPA: hypothetical protein VEB68_12665 [Croceibacterium sp.]|nr:hypothetical protein [Croceibacterium sp.]
MPWILGFAPFIFVLVLVLGIVSIQSRARLEEKRIAAGAARQGDTHTRDAERIDELEERLRIVERIVTDGGYDLAQKIEALRDERPAVERLLRTRPVETADRLS